MKESLEKKLSQLLQRYQSINVALSDIKQLADNNKFRQLSIEHARLAPLAERFEELCQLRQQQSESRLLCEEDDVEIVTLAEQELQQQQARHKLLEEELQGLLLQDDEESSNSLFVEIRAGTGGQEAALFVTDLLRMYLRYAEQQGWQSEMIHARESEAGGYRETIMRLSGPQIFSRLRFEAGTHRVQRIPETESQGRIHTSAATVAILPEAAPLSRPKFNPAELRIDTFRASGAGGQHVNKTDSAVRITHLPSGIVAECQDGRSQHRNRAQAMELLLARLVAQQNEQQQAAEKDSRRRQIGSGDRAERIRTYNFPQARVTDHRIGLSLYKLDAILNGELELLISPLIKEHQAKRMAAIPSAIEELSL